LFFFLEELYTYSHVLEKKPKLSIIESQIMLNTPYQLEYKSGNFYERLDICCDIIERKAADLLADIYATFGALTVSDKLDLCLDFIILGTFWKNYNLYVSVPLLNSKRSILKVLYLMLYASESSKPIFDNIRGVAAAKLLLDYAKTQNAIFGIEELRRLIAFLDATNEFEEETIRMAALCDRLALLDETERALVLSKISELTGFFISISNTMLSEFTDNVRTFLEHHRDNYFNKENYFFTGRQESEYHLNMVGAALMNRSLRPKFDDTSEKVVILPTCMTDAVNCKAKKEGDDLVCTRCNKSCNVMQIMDKSRILNCKIVLIRHSSNFSKWLEPWANQSHTGVVGVACVLNLLKGGFEMKRLGIPSQCVFLNFAGCKKHWKIGVPTEINLHRLAEVVR
jgi:hypothetical protein